jgi:hypothetical protein
MRFPNIVQCSDTHQRATKSGRWRESFVQPEDHMLLVEILVADAHCPRFHPKGAESKRPIEISSPSVFRINAKLDLKHTFLTSKGYDSREQLSCKPLTTLVRADKHAPQHRFVPDLAERLAAKACNASQLHIDEGAEYDLCIGPLDTSLDFLDGAPGFFFVRGPYRSGRIGYRLQTHLPECCGVNCAQGSNIQVFHLRHPEGLSARSAPCPATPAREWSPAAAG